MEELEAFGAILSGWVLEWDDLSDDTPSAKLARADTMADINTKQAARDDQPIFAAGEIRAEAGHDEEMPEAVEGDEDA